MIWNGWKEQVERQPIWDMVQPFPTHNSFSLRIPQCFTFFPYKSLLLAHSDPGAAGQDTSCLDSHNGAGAGDIQKSLEILISTLSMFSTDISLEGSSIKHKIQLVQVCQVLLQSILVFLQNLPPGSQDVLSPLLHVTETSFALHTRSTGLTQPFTALRFLKNSPWALFLSPMRGAARVCAWHGTKLRLLWHPRSRSGAVAGLLAWPGSGDTALLALIRVWEVLARRHSTLGFDKGVRDAGPKPAVSAPPLPVPPSRAAPAPEGLTHGDTIIKGNEKYLTFLAPFHS